MIDFEKISFEKKMLHVYEESFQFCDETEATCDICFDKVSCTMEYDNITDKERYNLEDFISAFTQDYMVTYEYLGNGLVVKVAKLLTK